MQKNHLGSIVHLCAPVSAFVPSRASVGSGTSTGSAPGSGNAVQTLHGCRTDCAVTSSLVDDGLFHWYLPDWQTSPAPLLLNVFLMLQRLWEGLYINDRGFIFGKAGSLNSTRDECFFPLSLQKYVNRWNHLLHLRNNYKVRILST